MIYFGPTELPWEVIVNEYAFRVEPSSNLQKNEAGLCADCRYMRLIESDRGAIFYRCQRSDSDPAFPKYPRLPVIQCTGYEARLHG